MQDEEVGSKPLGRCSVFTYGVGHMLNDITSACWFTYLLVFLTDIGLSPGYVYIPLLLAVDFFIVDDRIWGGGCSLCSVTVLVTGVRSSSMASTSILNLNTYTMRTT